MKYDIYSPRLSNRPSHPTQGGLTKAPKYKATYGKLSFIGKLVQRNLGRRGLTLAMKLERLISNNKYADQRI